MKTIEKFVIDEDDTYYFYVEKKLGEFNNIIYHIYYNNYESESLNFYEFSEIYGNYLRISVKEFISVASNDLLGYNDLNLLRNFRVLNKKINNNINPNVNRVKKLLISSIYSYDEIIKEKLLINDYLIDYEKDMEKLALPYDDYLLRVKE